MLRNRLRLKNRPGVALAVVAVSLVGLLAIMALAIDMGMMYSSRSEAQRVADAAALAGASAFLDPQYATPSAALMPARAQAYDYALQNYVLGELVDSSETNVTIDTNLRRVTVIMFRMLTQVPSYVAIGMWFVFQIVSGMGVFGGGSQGGGVAYMAHIGGFICGFVLVRFFAIGLQPKSYESY